MSTQSTKELKIYTHFGRVVIQSVDDTKEPIYLETALAEHLIDELKTAVPQIKNGYHYPSTNIKG